MSGMKEHQNQNVLDGCSIQIKGLVTEVSDYEKNGKYTYSAHIVSPGSSPVKIKILGDPTLYRAKIGSVVDMKITIRENKFGVFFEEAATS
ncbi:MAG: hypothetical protein GY795_07160 [Desulfobacterales bacterium]|nr:hypothetical protein [Desulfobacterales bacterium]